MADRPSSEGAAAFVRSESGSAGLLLAATLVALVWANSPVASAYEDVLGGETRHWVNDGAMAFFFYLVGLEIRRELVFGELRDRRAAAIPAVAAVAGMAVPALIYLAINAGGPGARGWGIVMATDIAFVLGAVALLGSRCSPGVRIFLLTLAIVDDIGAVTVIAVFYSEGIDPIALAGAVALTAVVAFAAPRRAFGAPVYLAAGIALWLLTLASGVHPTLAGVAMGLVTAVRPAGDSPNERFEDAIAPWTSLLVVPLFALANAGVHLDPDALSRASTSAVTLGVIAGLVIGKGLGVWALTTAAVRSGAGRLPEGMGSGHVLPAATLAGIGFTVSLFVTELAFPDEVLREEAKIGVLVASAVAAVLGWALFRFRRVEA